MHDRGSPTAVMRAGQRVGSDLRQLGEQRMNGLTELTDPFAVNNAHLQEAALAARRQILRNEVLDLFWTKGVQIQLTRNGERNRLRAIGLRIGVNVDSHSERLKPIPSKSDSLFF